MSQYSDKYELVVGLEIHVQLNTNGKIFSPEENSFAAVANSETHPVSLSHPGTLPRLHPEVVEKAIRLGLALECEISEHSFFDRKNYFYPDSPKGYQISQDSDPICIGGVIVLEGKEKGKMIRVHHIHMEEDAGKSMHDQSPGHSMIDLNRAGTPLLEIVTEPDFRSADEAAACLYQLQHLVRYLDVSEAEMEKGHLRCDANISVRRYGEPEFGTRAEVKNLNSMRFVKKAIAFEFDRQCALIESGGTVVQETRGFDPSTGKTSSQREKEMAQDYRYFPDPDLAPLQCSADLIEGIREASPELPKARKERYQKELGLSEYDAGLLLEQKQVADFFDDVQAIEPSAKTTANWLLNDVKAWVNEQDDKQFPAIPAASFAALIKVANEGSIPQHTVRNELLAQLLEDPGLDIEAILSKWSQISKKNENFADVLVKEVLANFPKEVQLYKNGKKQLLGMFMGELMKAAKGQIDPQEARQQLQKELEK